MKVVRAHRHAEVEAFELGFAPVGRPLFTVFCYLIDGLLIDTSFRYVRREIMGLLSSRHIEHIVLTHHHEDHSGNAATIKHTRDIKVSAHPEAARKLRHGFNILPYQYLYWGMANPLVVQPCTPVVETSRHRFLALHTPGHSKDHLVFLEQDEGWLFSGDLYLGDRIKYFRSDERIGDQIDSIQRLLTYDFEQVFCSHRPRLRHGKQHFADKLQFLQDFVGSVEVLLNKGLGQRDIERALGHEVWSIRLTTTNNVSFAHLVRSAIEAARKLDGSQLALSLSRGQGESEEPVQRTRSP